MAVTKSAFSRWRYLLLLSLFLGGCPLRDRTRFRTPLPPMTNSVVTVDKQGKRIVAGSFEGTLTVAPPPLNSVGGRDGYVARLASPPWKVVFSGPGDQTITGVTVDGENNIVVVGTFDGEMTVQNFKLTVPPDSGRKVAVFAAKVTPTGSVTWVKPVARLPAPATISVGVGPDQFLVIGSDSDAPTAIGDQVVAPSGGQSTVIVRVSPGGDVQGAPDRVVVAASVACAHDPCSTGSRLNPNCNQCVGYICSPGHDPYCCHTAWDSLCVQEAKCWCRMNCPGVTCPEEVPPARSPAR